MPIANVEAFIDTGSYTLSITIIVPSLAAQSFRYPNRAVDNSYLNCRY